MIVGKIVTLCDETSYAVFARGVAFLNNP